MPYEVAHEPIQDAEEAADKRAEIKQEILKENILERILEGWKTIEKLEAEIAALAIEEERLNVEGKTLRARFTCWKARRKQSKLDALKRITPSKESLL